MGAEHQERTVKKKSNLYNMHVCKSVMGPAPPDHVC